MTEELNFYSQEDIDVINEIASDGSDMSQEMIVDIDLSVEDEETAQKLCDKLEAEGLDFEMFQDEETDALGICVSISMLLTPQNVGDAQTKLQALASEFGGAVEGWGTYGNNFDALGDELDG
jgi:regulator of RNase E activity RraB